MTRRVPVSNDPPCREPRLQRDGQPRVKIPGVAERVWRDALARDDASQAGVIVADFDADFRELADS